MEGRLISLVSRNYQNSGLWYLRITKIIKKRRYGISELPKWAICVILWYLRITPFNILPSVEGFLYLQDRAYVSS